MKEIFWVFLRLGCHAFGGPNAHFGYFYEEFVKRRKWMGESEYADTVALCQFLPGPSSSQAGFAIGLKRGGTLGAFAAWVGFTLPSAVLMIAFALGLGHAGDLATAGWVTGLKLAAVAVVANAAWGMAVTLCPAREQVTIAALVMVALLLFSHPLAQLLAIIGGALAGWILFREEARMGPTGEAELVAPSGRRRVGAAYLAAFGILLVGLPALAQVFSASPEWAVADAFYRAGSLVFGGGHVVLPLLDGFTVQQGWIDASSFLAGYGAAQALPGPLFAFAAFLGAGIDRGFGGVAGGVFALAMIYLPSWLLVLGAKPFWERLRRVEGARAALVGANAAVVGLLFAALYQPIWTSSILNGGSLAFALVAFVALKFWRVPPWILALAGALLGQLLF